MPVGTSRSPIGKAFQRLLVEVGVASVEVRVASVEVRVASVEVRVASVEVRVASVASVEVRIARVEPAIEVVHGCVRPCVTDASVARSPPAALLAT